MIKPMNPMASLSNKKFIRQNLTKPEILEKLEVRKKSLLADIESLEAETREPVCLSRKEIGSIKNVIKEKIEKLSSVSDKIKDLSAAILKSEK